MFLRKHKTACRPGLHDNFFDRLYAFVNGAERKHADDRKKIPVSLKRGHCGAGLSFLK